MFIERECAVAARVFTVKEMLAAWSTGARWCTRASDNDHWRCGRTRANAIANDGGITVRDMETAGRSAEEWASTLAEVIVREAFDSVTDMVKAGQLLNGLTIDEVVTLGKISSKWLRRKCG